MSEKRQVILTEDDIRAAIAGYYDLAGIEAGILEKAVVRLVSDKILLLQVLGGGIDRYTYKMLERLATGDE